MRKLGKSLVAALFATALLVACTDQPAPTESSAVDTPTLNWMNNPDNGNVRIYRDVGFWAVCWTDAQNGLRACHSNNPLGGGSEPDCGLQQQEGGGIEFQVVGDPSGDWFHEVDKGEAFITIRDLNASGACFGAALVAEGWGDLMYVDNDILGSGQGGNTNAWRFSGHSNDLTAPDDGRVKYSGHVQRRWNYKKGEGTETSSKVNVH